MSEQTALVNLATNNSLDGEKLSHLLECKKSAQEYRNNFKSTWDECTAQVRCVLPEDYKLKESWQTKIYIPLQAKTSEVAFSMLSSMIYGKGLPIDISGEGIDDERDAANFKEVLSVIFRNGRFDFNNNFVLQESVDIGTSFIKLVLLKKNKLSFVWRSPYNCLIDPSAGNDLSKARFIIDQYTKDIASIIQESRKEKGLYSKDVIAQYLLDGVEEAKKLMKNKGHTGSDDVKEALSVVKSIDGTEDVTIPSRYTTVSLDEYWIQMPNKNGTYDSKVITVMNDRYVLREDPNEFGFLPFQGCRIKPRIYDYYGKGYIENTRGLQDLANSCVNLGFDSLKISSMDIVVIDDSKVKDPTSIKYKPLAVWKMKDINAVKINRQPMSAISDVLRGLTLIDNIHQDSSGVTRQAQGANNMSNSGTDSDTLGEYKLKLQMLDRRFLSIARFIEDDYLVPLCEKVIKCLVNPNLFTQEFVDKILGFDEFDDSQIINGELQIVGKKKEPKLLLSKFGTEDELDLNIKAVGVTQFTERLEMLGKLEKAVIAATSNPTLGAMTKIDVLWKRIFEYSDLPGYEDILKSKEEMKEELDAQEQIGSMPIPEQMFSQQMQGQQGGLNA